MSHIQILVNHHEHISAIFGNHCDLNLVNDPKKAKVSKAIGGFRNSQFDWTLFEKKIRLKQNQMKGLLKHRMLFGAFLLRISKLYKGSSYQVTLLGSKEDFFQPLWVELPAKKTQDWNSFHKDTAELGRYVDISCQCMTCGTSN